MSPKPQIALLFATLLATGCSSTTTPPAVLEPGPHHGFVRPISGEAGFVEIVTEPVKGAAPSLKFRLAVYFLNPDRTRAFQPAPTEVRMEVTWPDASPRQTLDLTADPADAAKFVSKPIESDASPGGTLNAKLGDRAITAAL